MNYATRPLMSFCLTSVILVSSAAGAAKDSSNTLSDEIKRERKALQELKEEIEDKQKKADEASEQRQSVLQSIQNLDDKLIVRRQQRYSVSRELKEKDRELESISDQLDQVRTRMQERRHSIRTRLRVQYKQGRLGYLRPLLSADKHSDLHRRFQYLSAISQREYDLLETYKQDIDRLGHIEREQATAREQMLRLKQSTDRKLREIRDIKQQKQRFLTKVTREKEYYEEALKELQESEARVDSLLNELEQRRKTMSARRSGKILGFRGVKGTLPWPATGKVVSFFGRQKHPTFETYIDRKGIEIRTGEGGRIRAVMGGVVAYADWLKGYGLVAILDHQNGFFSLYAHASKLLTAVGAKVQAGEVIGETGDTGIAQDNTLYFELRDGAEPVDPLLWLATRP